MGKTEGTRSRCPARSTRCWAGVLAVALTGCLWDYSFDGGYRKASTVAIPIFDNATLRRGNEFELTDVVAREVITRTPYRVVASPSEADVVVRGKIVQFSQPVVVPGFENSVREGSVVIAVKVTIVEGRTGKLIADPPAHAEQAYIVAERGGTLGTARAEVFDRLAQWIVQQLEVPW